ncbi:MAG: threonine/serine exporter family protein [Eubacteriales bacterium]|nr:threonine/serine exporter family protein [Eubacteriales bacterium]
MEKSEVKRVLKLALNAGKMLLEYGAETYRVEETINSICINKGLHQVQSFVVPTGIFLNVEYDDEYYSLIHRTTVKRIDLEIISMVNDFSRKLLKDNMSIEDGEKELEKIENAPVFSLSLRLMAGGMAGGFFTLLFGGNVVEFLIAFINSILVVLFTTMASQYKISFFLKNLLGGMVNMAFALVLVKSIGNMVIDIQIDSVIIGSLMPLVPGVAIVNAIRDIISGDFVSGTSRLTEAVLIAVALALGVGTVLQGYIFIVGGSL